MMFKCKKCLKFIFSATAITVATTSTSLAMASCHVLNKHSWKDFKTAALNETAPEIVAHASVKANSWNSSDTQDFTFLSVPSVGIDGETIVAIIASTSHKNIAAFTATFKKNTQYEKRDWDCTTQPKDDHVPDFDDFKTKAMAESEINIVSNAKVRAKGWDVSKDNNFKFKIKAAVGVPGSTVVATITSIFDNNNIAVFTATYVNGQKYVATDWTCTTQPRNANPSFNDFVASARADSAINIIANAKIKATGWDASKTDDFSFSVKPAVEEPGVSVVTTIASATNKNFAIFKITYIINQKYLATNWTCIVQPTTNPQWQKYVYDASEDVGSWGEILNVLKYIEQIHSDVHFPNKLDFHSSKVVQSLRIAPDGITPNPNKRTVTFEILYTDVYGANSSLTIVATQSESENYSIDDFDIPRPQTAYSKWYDSAIAFLSDEDKSKSDNSLVVAIIDKADQTETPNLYKIAQEANIKTLVYSRSNQFLRYEATKKILEFKVSLLSLSDDSPKILNIAVIIKYSPSFGATFNKKNLTGISIQADGTLPG